jgi:diguanylate cyclase (GGDEF)-like protein
VLTPATPRRGAALFREDSRARAALRWTYALLAVFLVAYLVYLVAQPARSYSTLVDGWLVDAFELTVAALCLSRALVQRRGRGVALALGLGALTWAIGDVILTVQSLGGATPSVPSYPDIFYLCFYPLTYTAVVLYMRNQVRRLSAPSWLDGAVAGLGAAAVCAAFAFHSILHVAGGSTASVVTNLAYPIGDLLLMGLVIGGSAVMSGQRRAPWLLLALGLGINVVGDTANLFQNTVGSSRYGGLLDAIAWPTALLLISGSVWLRPRPADPNAAEKPIGFALPGAATAAGLLILVVGSVHSLPRVAVGLATLTLLVVGVRLTMSVRGLRILTLERHRQAITDDLTGLRNRRYLLQVLDEYFSEGGDGAAQERQLAFLFVDLDHFKEVNDSFGHPAGDELLRQLGPRLRGALRSTDVLVRLGGDEFAVVLTDADAEYATTVARRLTASLDEPFQLEVVSARISSSIGIALAPADADNADTLLWASDVAMYRAKLGEVPFALYEQEIDRGGDRLRLVEELRAAVEGHQLVLHYQPQLDLRTGEIFAVEALVRWPHPRLGLVPPLKFLPLAEEAGLMGVLTASVLDDALTQCAAWRRDGLPLTVSVNVSASNLLDHGFSDMVASFLTRHGLPAEALVLEITETSIISDFERSQRVIEDLRDQGIIVSIDDFGAGFTSLAHLSNLAVRELKLDRCFITPLAAGDNGLESELVRATIDLGHAMGLRVVAEGIEDRETLDLLTRLGCDIAQGYFISRPKPADQLAFRTPLGTAAHAASFGAAALSTPPHSTPALGTTAHAE